MSLSRILEYTKPEKITANNVLLEIARKVINSSPEPMYKIKLRDEVLTMKEKERLGFNFNRSVTASLRSRWDVVEKATVDYLKEITDMNDQIEDDGRKYENQLINLIVTRTTNLGLNSRIEQMAGLFMHMNFYCTILKFKIQHLETTRAFMFTCSDLMGFSRPSQLIDRYAALQHVFAELYADYEMRQNLLNHLTETLGEVKAETNHRNMLMHNQMAEMHARIKHLQTESAQLERAIIEQMELSTGASLEIYKIKNAVYNIYTTMTTYRGMESSLTDSYAQLGELEVRIIHTQGAVKMLQIEEAKRQAKKKARQKGGPADPAYKDEDIFSESAVSDSNSDDNEKINLNISAVASSSTFAGTPGFQGTKFRRSTVRNNPDIVSSETTNSSYDKSKTTNLPKISTTELFMVGNLPNAEKNVRLPLIDLNYNKTCARKLGPSTMSNRGCVSLTTNQPTLTAMRSLKRSATALVSDTHYLKQISQTKQTDRESLPESVYDAAVSMEMCSNNRALCTKRNNNSALCTKRNNNNDLVTTKNTRKKNVVTKN